MGNMISIEEFKKKNKKELYDDDILFPGEDEIKDEKVNFVGRKSKPF